MRGESSIEQVDFAIDVLVVHHDEPAISDLVGDLNWPPVDFGDSSTGRASKIKVRWWMDQFGHRPKPFATGTSPKLDVSERLFVRLHTRGPEEKIAGWSRSLTHACISGSQFLSSTVPGPDFGGTAMESRR